MVKTVLVPLDASELAEGVLPYAEHIASRTEAVIVLLTSITGKETEAARDYLEGRGDALEAKGLKARVEILYGEPAEAVLNYAADEDVDLIAMATHGRSGVTRWVFGSVADKVLHNTHCPLLLVRPDATERAPAIEKILVPLDGSQLSLAVLPFIKETAKALGASLVLFHAVAPVGTFPGVEMGAASVGHLLQGLEDQAQQFLREAVKEVKEYGVDASYAVVIGFPVDSVIRAAEDTGADLIALSTHGRSGLGRAVMGSVADGVVRRISLPCLIVRPPEVEKGS